MSITFKKNLSSSAAANIRFPAGTRLNSNGNLLLTSTGINSFDSFIGGGLPIGSLIIIYEDKNSVLSDSVLRCYFSEGVYSKHDLCVVNLRSDLTENLPVKEETVSVEQESEKMKIAWRYENLSTLNSTTSTMHYDLQSTKALPHELLEQIQIHKLTWHDYLQAQSSLSYRQFLLERLQKFLTLQYSSQQTEKRILRIGIQSLSSTLFDTNPSNHVEELTAFLYQLRILLRSSLATCVITLNEKSKIFETIADMVFEFKVSNFPLNDYVGFCQLIKLPRLNTIQPLIPETWDIGIKLIKHRKNLIFEKYSIPPDLSEDASREDKQKNFSCTPSKELDF